MIFPVVFFALFPALLIAFRLFDRLARLEYERYPKDWEEDGRPHGFFWAPSGARTFGGLTPRRGSSIARFTCTLSWLCGTPDWMRGEPKALKLVVWYRILVVAWNVGIVGAFALSATQ